MRHSRRAVMAERYKLYMKKNIFNGKYFVRNLQIGICIIAVAALISGTAILTHTKQDGDKAEVSADVSVKELLFGKSEEEKEAVREPDTEEETVGMTEQMTAEVMTAEEATVIYAESESEESYTEEPIKKSAFDGKCIANVEESLNIRKEPSADSEFVGSMNSGAIAIVEGTEAEWTKIKSGDVEGYVLTEYVLTGEKAEQFAADYVTLVGTVLEDGVNIRTEKSTDAEILTVLNKDDTITVLENPKKEEAVSEDDTMKEPVQNSTEEVHTAESITKAVETMAEQQKVEDKHSESRGTVEGTITWVPVMLEDGQTGYVSAELVDIDELYQIAVSAEELERRAAEKEAARKAAEEAAAREAAAKQAAAAAQAVSNNVSSNTNSNSDNSDSYKGATTTPVTATESGECIGTFTVTGYCGCSKCSGHGKTASGTTPTEGRTIAADTSVLPFGTQVVIDGIVYTVEDCGSGVSGNHIDIFFATHEKAMAFGKKTIKVYKY